MRTPSSSRSASQVSGARASMSARLVAARSLWIMEGQGIDGAHNDALSCSTQRQHAGRLSARLRLTCVCCARFAN